MSPFRRSVCAAVSAFALAVCTTVVQAEPLAQAAGPTEIQPGNLLVLQVGGPAKWIVMPHSDPEYHLYVVTKSGDEVNVTVTKLPIGGGPDQPDPPPPDDLTLADRVDQWADSVGDPDSRAKLAAAYQFTLQAIDSGAMTSVGLIKAFQAAADTQVLGGDAAKWTAFLTNVKQHLDTLPDTVAAYREAWVHIAGGLARDAEAGAVRGELQRLHDERRQQ